MKAVKFLPVATIKFLFIFINRRIRLYTINILIHRSIENIPNAVFSALQRLQEKLLIKSLVKETWIWYKNSWLVLYLENIRKLKDLRACIYVYFTESQILVDICIDALKQCIIMQLYSLFDNHCFLKSSEACRLHEMSSFLFC